jgi:hypothetical protein
MTGGPPPLQRVSPGGPGRATLALLVAGALLFIGLAIFKPWQEPAEVALLPDPEPTPAAATTPLPIAPGSAEPEPRPDASPGSSVRPAPRRWQDQLPWVVGKHHEWGVRVIVARTEPPNRRPRAILELWRALAPSSTDEPLALDNGGGLVLALGITAPDASPALDVRVWRDRAGSLEYATTDRWAVPGQSAEWLLVPSAAQGGGPWHAGRYRIDVLTGREILRIHVAIPGQELPFTRPPAELDQETLEWASGVSPSDPGAYALSSPGETLYQLDCLDATPGPPLDGAAAWLALPEAPSGEDGLDCGPRQHAWPTYALVLRLADGATVTDASLLRLEPDTSEPIGGLVVEHGVYFLRPDSTAWSPGTYRIDARWRTPAGKHRHGSWVLHLYPNEDGDAPLLLEAARRSGVISGRWGLIGGLAGTPVEQEPGSAPSDPEALAPRCAGAALLIPEEVVIVGYDGERPVAARIERIFAGGSRREQPAYVALDAVPGALLIAPVDDRVWRPGYYAVTVTQEPSADDVIASTLVFCVGMYEPNGELVVPGGAGGLEAGD